ncbi:MAG: ATP-binding protein [Labilithrix sp.]|nr:ATP-binding protein [Labilithrix sp.]
MNERSEAVAGPDWLSGLLAPSACPRCKGKARGGWMCERCAAEAERAAANAARREDHADRLAAYTTSVPKLYHPWACAPEKLAETLVVTAPQIQARDREAVLRVPHDVPMLVLSGHAGAGKTTLAVARGRALVDSGKRVLFVAALDLGGAVRDTRLGQACELLGRAKRAPVLIVDDLGKELRLGPLAAAALVDVISARHAHMRPTVVTTGLRSAEIKSGYEDDGMVRRLMEKGRATVLRLGPQAGERSDT